MSLSTIIRPITECNKPVIKIIATDSCESTSGALIDGSDNVQAFPFQNIINIKGFVRDIPREIIRQNSKNCRVQRTQSAIKYEVIGAEVYPSWKMREIEEAFSKEKIEIDGQEILYSGGTMFEAVGSSCTKMYKLKTIVEECQVIKIFGCPTNCDPTTENFLIPFDGIPDTYFGDNGGSIANNYSQLLSYYRQQGGVIEVNDITAPLNIQCDYYKIFEVKTIGSKPAPFYVNNVTPPNKVFAVTLDANNPDYNKLCRGVDNTACLTPIIEPPLVYELTCGDITIGEISQYSIGMSCALVLFGDWEQHTGDTGIITLGNTRTINLSIINPNYTPTSGTSGTWDKEVSSAPEACTIPTPIPLTATIDVVEIDGVPTVDYTFSTTTGELTFDPCLDVGADIHVEFTTAAASPILTGEVIAQINGTNCLPKTNIYQTNTNNSSIPVGSTLIIKSNGDIQWIGQGTSADIDGTVIEVTDIIYEII